VIYLKINKIKINSYGKLQDKEINIKDKINIIYGENESGKSTILKFILNSFYGTSKNKKGKDISDFEKYKPWTGEKFSGKIEYELDNGKKFEVFREFNKKNPKIFNEQLEDISKQFNIDKNKGNDFFYEQTKIDEELFLSTAAILQQEVKLEKNMQNTLIQKIYNIVGTGDDNVSFKRAMERLARRQLDEVGTDRSREKPINIIERKIEKIENEKNELQKYEELKYEIEKNKTDLLQEISKEEIKNNILVEIKNLNEKENLEKEKIKIQEKIINDNSEKIKLLKNKLNEINNEKNKKIDEFKNKKEKIKIKNKKTNKKIIIFFLIVILINIIQWIYIKNRTINYILSLTVPTYLIFYILIKNKLNKKEKNNILNLDEEDNKIKEIENEINLIENNKNNIENEIKNIKNNFNLKNNLEKEKIKKEYFNKIEINDLNNYLNSQNINYLLNDSQNKLNNLKIKLHSLDLDNENVEPKLENYANLEEELERLSEQYVNLKDLNTSIELAKEVLENSYLKMKETVTPKFTQELSKAIYEITDGKYSKVKYNDEIGLVTETENGNYVLVDRLSAGTIDQLYLSLRLSIIKELSEEKIPILLDESFAYYDDERLKNILKYIYKEFNNIQIIIFTCTKREIKILDELKINYNLIKM